MANILYDSSGLTISLLLLLFFSHGRHNAEASHQVHDRFLTSETTSDVGDQDRPYRTGYHFQPPKNWMNDPNGPLIYNGIYHLFYQWNPKGVVWGNIVWAHSTSADLINWIPHDVAIYPSQPSDINGCWSGSASILPSGKPVILYTGINPNDHQVQNIAFPKNLSDPYLTEWVKSPRNPLMAPDTENHINGSSFRDPTTVWRGPDGRWRVIIGSKINRRGLAILYTSKDFVNWVKSPNPLHFVDGNGMWECPDFFPVLKHYSVGVDTSVMGSFVKHVLKVSLDETRHEYYTIGTYDHNMDKYIPDQGSVENDSGLRFDYGKFYASKTFFDSAKKRRILWGWINESSSVEDDIKKGWSGVQAIPRSLWLARSEKQLIQRPISEVKSLRTNEVHLPKKMLKNGSIVEVPKITAAQADVEVWFKVGKQELEKAEVMDPSWGHDPQIICSQRSASVEGSLGPFGLMVLASSDLKEYTAVYFRIFRSHPNVSQNYIVLMCSDQSRSSLNEGNDKTTYGAFLELDPRQEMLSLRSLIDHSIIESFGGGGRVCITARVYPTLAIRDAARLYAFNYGNDGVRMQLTAWSMKNARVNDSNKR